MLASPHFFSSPAVLGWLGVVVGVATLAVIVAQFYIGASRRVLTYSLVSDAALISLGAREKAGPDLQVTLGDSPLNDPHVVSIQIEYKGRRDIREDDFQGRKPLVVDVGAPILKHLNPSPVHETIPSISILGDKKVVEIGPDLITSGQLITIDLLTDGSAKLRSISSLADVIIRESQVGDEYDLIWIKRAQNAAFTLFGIGLLGWFVAEQTPFYFVLVVWLLGAAGFLILIARAATSARRHRGKRSTAVTSDEAATANS